MNRIRINPGDTVPLYLDEREWSLVRHDVPVSSVIEKRFQQASTKKEGVCVPLTLDDLDELAEIASTASEQEKHELKRKIWVGLFARLRTMLDTYTDGEDEFWDAVEEEILNDMGEIGKKELSAGWEERFAMVMEDSAHKTLEEINTALERARVDYNREAQDDLGNMTPEQVYHLIYSNWDDSRSLIHINSDLVYEDVRYTPYYQNACLLLGALMEENGKTKATGKGFLNRKFVERLLVRFVMPEKEKISIRQICKVINERDIKSIHITRVLLDLAGCLKLRNNYFSITQKGKKYLQEKQAGAFFAHLFKTHYNVLNLSYLDFWGANPPLQTGIAFTLYQLSQRAQDWVQLSEILNRIVLPSTIDYVNNPPRTYFRDLSFPVFFRILSPLHDFGLLEFREYSEDLRSDYGKLIFRKTPLFDRAVQFNLDGFNSR